MRKLLLAAGIFLAVTGIPFFVRAVTVGPVKLEYSANPGDVISGNLFLQNEQADTETFYPSFQGFSDQSGDKVFFTEKIGLSTWIKTVSSTTLKPGEQEQVPFTITVPNDAPPGGHFAVIWWSTTPPSQSNTGQLAVVSRAGILVYLQVSGNVVESGEVSDLSTGQMFYWNSVPLDVALIFKNNGNSYLKPAGAIGLKNVFGMTQASAVVNQYGMDILPQSQKSLSATLDPLGMVFGPYRVTANITYGADNKKVATRTIWIWILPWPILIGVILFLIVVFIGLPKGIRRYNRWIIEKAQGGK